MRNKVVFDHCRLSSQNYSQKQFVDCAGYARTAFRKIDQQDVKTLGFGDEDGRLWPSRKKYVQGTRVHKLEE